MIEDSRRPKAVKPVTKEALAPRMYEEFSQATNWSGREDQDWSGITEQARMFWLEKADKALWFISNVLPGVPAHENLVVFLAYAIWEEKDGIAAWVFPARFALNKVNGHESALCFT